MCVSEAECCQHGRVREYQWIQEHWPADARRDPRFEGLHGAVAELRQEGDLMGFAMMSVNQWATQKWRLWRRRLVSAEDRPDLDLSLFDEKEGFPTSWWTMSPEEATRMYEECVVRGRLEWEGSVYDLRWLPADEAATVRAERFWEPD